MIFLWQKGQAVGRETSGVGVESIEDVGRQLPSVMSRFVHVAPSAGGLIVPPGARAHP
jgi:hypothetical protein